MAHIRYDINGCWHPSRSRSAIGVLPCWCTLVLLERNFVCLLKSKHFGSHDMSKDVETQGSGLQLLVQVSSRIASLVPCQHRSSLRHQRVASKPTARGASKKMLSRSIAQHWCALDRPKTFSTIQRIDRMSRTLCEFFFRDEMTGSPRRCGSQEVSHGETSLRCRKRVRKGPF